MAKRKKSSAPKAKVKGRAGTTRVPVQKADPSTKKPKQAKPKELTLKKHKGDIFEGRRDDMEAEPDQFLETEEHPWTHEEQEMRMHLGYATPDVYSPEGREELEEEEGEIEPWEEGFMEGAESKGELAECANCEKPLNPNRDKIVEREIKGRLVWYCSQKCAKSGKK